MPAGTASSSHITALASGWTNEEVLDLVQQRLGKRACWYQIEVAKAFYNGYDVIGCAPTGAGKTLSFWIPLLMAEARGHKKILFVISPLNVLAKQNVNTLLDVGIPAIAVAAENATAATFKEIEKGKYSVVVTNPEILMTSEELKVLWSTPSFARRLLGFVFDEAHCIAQWGRFRKHYLAVGTIRYLVSEPFPVYIASATLPPPLLAEIRKLLHMNPQNTKQILCSNDRPDIALMVRELAHAASSYEDLAFLIPYNWSEGMAKPKKFLVFFDDIKEAEGAKKYFHQRLQQEYHSKVAWFHSTMSQQYREQKVKEFKQGEVWGLFCTDAFGLGMDIGDVEVVVQYKATCDLCTLWQRFGRAARSPEARGVGILLVEKKDTVMGRKGVTTGSKRNSGDLQTGRRQRQKRTGGSTSSQIPTSPKANGQPSAPDAPTAQIPTGNIDVYSALPVAPQRRPRASNKCGSCGQPGHNKRSCGISKQVKVELMDSVIASSPQVCYPLSSSTSAALSTYEASSSTTPQTTAIPSDAPLPLSGGTAVSIPSSTHATFVTSATESKLPPWYQQLSVPGSYQFYPNWQPWANYPQSQHTSQPNFTT